MLPGIPGSAMCVQGFDDSLNSAIHTTYRISLRPSSLRLPRHPWFAIVKGFLVLPKGCTKCDPWFGFVISGYFLRFNKKDCTAGAVEGRPHDTGYVQQSRRQDLTIHLCRKYWRLSHRVRFAVGKLTTRDPGTNTPGQ